MPTTDYEQKQSLAEIEEEQIRLAGGETMDEMELEGIIGGLIDDAVDYIDLTEAPDRVKATDYYNGKPFGNEEAGRSQVVDMTVRDTVSLMLPQIMRTFFGSERVVSYTPRFEEDVKFSEQASDYVNSVVLGHDNPDTFNTFLTIFKDALIRRVGICRVDWEQRESVQHEEFTGLDDASLEALMNDPDIEGSQIESYPDPSFVPPEPPPPPPPGQPGPEGQPGPPPGPPGPEGISPGGPQQMQAQEMEVPHLHDVVIRRTRTEGSVVVEAIPCEEFLIDRRAKNIEESSIVAHRRYLTISELVQMGYDYDEMLSLSGDEDEFGNNTEFVARHSVGTFADSPDAGEANKRVLYIEAYAKVDYGNTGIAELRRFCCAGNHHKVLHHGPVNTIPFQIFCGLPEGHLWKGASIADLTSDIQLIKSSVLRNMLDSLAKSIHPDTWILDGACNTDDVLSQKLGKIIRVRQPGAIGELQKSFSGKEAFPMLDYLDQIKEDRTGLSRASAGLDPSALQSTAKAAVSLAAQASQAQIELLCRTFAETAMKPLFKKILKLLVTHQEKARTVRLRNEWVPIDPRVWDSGMDVSINVALGLGTNEERMGMLAGLAAKQEKILQEQGPENPLVTYQQYHNTLKKMTELSGFKDVQSFWTDPATYKAPKKPPPEPSPDEIFATAQADKIRADIELDKLKHEQANEKMLREDDLQRDKLESDIELKKKEMENKYQTMIDTTEIKGMIEREREQIRATAQAQNQAPQPGLPQVTSEEMEPTNMQQPPQMPMPN